MSTHFWPAALDQAGFATMHFLLSALWQSSLLFVAVFGLAWLLRRRRAAVRHRLWIVALLVAPFLPFITSGAKRIGAPQAPLPVLPEYVHPSTNAEPAFPRGEFRPHRVFPLPESPAPSVPVFDGVQHNRETPPPAPEPAFRILLGLPWAMGFLAYAAGLCVFLGLIAMGRLRIWRWTRSAVPCESGRVHSAFGRARDILGTRCGTDLLESHRVPAPISTGTIRPRVLMPKGLSARLSDVELLAVALHETAHHKRLDPLTLTIAAFVRAAFFFHPLVWLAARQVSTLSEHCADDAVLDATGEPLPYAKLLARLAEDLPRRPLATEMAAGLLLGKGAFLRRVEAILSDRRDQIRKLTRRALVASVLAIVFSVGLAATLPLGEKAALEADLAGDAGPNDARQREVLEEMRRRLSTLSDPEGDLHSGIPGDLVGFIRTSQPASGDALLSILGNSQDPLNRRATNAFLATWNNHSTEQIGAFFENAMTAYIQFRPQYPKGLKAYIGTGYTIRHGWGGWPREPGPEIKTISTRQVDGRPYGKPFNYNYPMAGSGGIRVDELQAGTHTAQAFTEYQITVGGLTYTGMAKSEVARFEITPAEAPNELAAPFDQALDEKVRRAFRFGDPRSTDIDLSKVLGGPKGDRRPQSTCGTEGSDTETCLFLARWELTEALPVDLCFAVEYHVIGTDEVHEGDPLVVLKGRKYLGYFALRRPHRFADGKEGVVPVRIVLKPSHATALSRTDVTRYYNGELASGDLVVEIERYSPASLTPRQKEMRAMFDGLENNDQIDRNTLNALEALTSANPYRRKHAFAMLRPGKGRNVAPAIPFLVKILDDSTTSFPTHSADRAVSALAEMGDLGIRPLTDALEHKSADVRRRAAEALNNMAVREQRRDTITATALPSLIVCLGDEDPGVRRMAAHAMYRIHDPTAVDALIRALKDKDPQTRAHAAMALGAIGDGRAAMPLYEALRDSDAQVRREAASAVKQLRDVDPETARMAPLMDANPHTREAAVWRLAMLKDKEMMPVLIRALEDEYAGVRIGAAYALGEMRDPRVAKPLIDVLATDNAGVRGAASQALEKITGRDFGEDRARWLAWWNEKKANPDADPPNVSSSSEEPGGPEPAPAPPPEPENRSATDSAAVPWLPVQLVSVKEGEIESVYRWRVTRQAPCRVLFGWYEYAGSLLIQRKAAQLPEGFPGHGALLSPEVGTGPVDLKVTLLKGKTKLRLVLEQSEAGGGEPLRLEHVFDLEPDWQPSRSSHVASPFHLGNARSQTLWHGGLTRVHENGSQGVLSLRVVARVAKDGETTETFRPPFDPLPVPPDYPFFATGRVTDHRGRPMYGVTVRAATGMGTLRGGGQTVTGPDGRYRLQFGPGRLMARKGKIRLGVGCQAAVIAARKNGWVEQNLGRHGNLVMAEGEELVYPEEYRKEGRYILPDKPYVVNFVLHPAAAIQGRMVDAKGRPVVGQLLYVDAEKLPPASSVFASSKTDKEGRFSFDGLPTSQPLWLSLRHTKGVDKKAYRHGIDLETARFNLTEPGVYDMEVVYDDKAPVFRVVRQSHRNGGGANRRAEEDIRRMLAGLPEIDDEWKPDIPAEVKDHVVTQQPASGNALLAIIAKPDDELHRRAVNVFLRTWESMSPQQLDAYFRKTIELRTRVRPAYPRGVKASIPADYGLGFGLRYGWGGWLSGNERWSNAGKELGVQTVTRHFLDGKPYGGPSRQKRYAAHSGSYRLESLELGEHSIHWVTEYEITYRGRKYTGKAQSPTYTFEIVSADTPDHLVAPDDPWITEQVRRAFRIMQDPGEPEPGKNRVLFFDDVEPVPRTPEITWKEKDGTEWAVFLPHWELTEELPVDLCFDVAFHVRGTEEVYEGESIIVPRGEKRSGYFCLRSHLTGFTKGKEGDIPVRLVLKPSRALALTNTRVSKYYGGELSSGDLVVRIRKYPPASVVARQNEVQARLEALENEADVDPAVRQFIRELRSTNPNRRDSAIRSVLRKPEQDRIPVIPVLIELLGDTTTSLPVAPRALGPAKLADKAAEALYQCGDSAVQPLADALAHKNAEVRWRAAMALNALATDERRAGMVPIALKPLLACLEDENVIVRRLAALALHRIHDATAVEPLIRVLKDKDTEARANAAMALGWIGDVRAVDPLFEATNDPQHYVRQSAIAALRRFQSIDPVRLQIASLKGSTRSERETAVSNLAVAKDKGAVPALIEVLKDNTSDIQSLAAYALGEINDPRAVKPLIDALTSDNPNLHISAPAALKKITGEDFGPDRDRWLQWWNEQSAEPTIDRPGVAPVPAEPVDRQRSNEPKSAGAGNQRGRTLPLKARFIAQLKDPDWLVREQSATALGEIGGVDLVEPLVAALEDERPEVRKAAATPLGEIGDRRAVEPLIAVLQRAEGESEVDAMVRALAGIGDPRAIDPIVKRLKNESASFERYSSHEITKLADPRINDLLLSKLRYENGNLNFNIVHQLVSLGEKRLVEPLIDALRQPQRRAKYREWTVSALGRLGDPRAVEPLIPLLQEGDASLREETARVLGRLGDEKAVAALQPFLNASEPSLRKAAADAIGDIRVGAMRAFREEGRERAVELIDTALDGGHESERRAALRALGAIGDEEATGRILQAFDDPEESVREEAFYVLVNQVRVEDAPEAFARALEHDDQRLRRHAAYQLARIGDRRSVPLLIETIEKGDPRRERGLVEKLGSLGDPRAVPLLYRLLPHEERRVRRAAAGALAHTADERALEPLLTALRNENEDSVRSQIVMALGRINDPRSIKALEDALADDGYNVSRLAAWSLARLGWRAPDLVLQIRYAVATGRAEEAGDIIPRARPAGDGNRLEGPFELGRPILTPLTVGTKEHPRVVMFHRIEFYRKGDDLRAKLMINHITWPASTWRIRIELLDEQRKTVAVSEKDYRVEGIAIGQSMLMSIQPHEFSFGQVPDEPRVRRFAITVMQVAPDAAG